MLDRQARLVAALALVLSSAGACSLVLPFGELQTGSTSSGGASASGSTSGAGGAGGDSCGPCVPAWTGAKTTCLAGVGCAQAPEVLARGPRGIAVDDDPKHPALYYLEAGTSGQADGELVMLPLAAD